MANTGAGLGTNPATAAQKAAPGGLPGIASSALASSNPQYETYGALLSQALPQISAYQTQAAGAELQGAVAGQLTGVQEQEAQSQGTYSAANALLSQQGLGLQGQALGSQAQTAAAQQGIEQSQYGINQTQYPEQLQEAALQNANAVRGAQDAAAVGGTLNTTGYQRQQGTQAAQYAWQQADIYRQQQLSQLAQQGQQVGYGGQQEQIANQMQQLAIQGKQQGLTAQQAQDQMNFGLQQLGYQGQDAALQYAQQVATAQGGAAATVAGVGAQAGLIGGMGPGMGSK